MTATIRYHVLVRAAWLLTLVAISLYVAKGHWQIGPLSAAGVVLIAAIELFSSVTVDCDRQTLVRHFLGKSIHLDRVRPSRTAARTRFVIALAGDVPRGFEVRVPFIYVLFDNRVDVLFTCLERTNPGALAWARRTYTRWSKPVATCLLIIGALLLFVAVR